MEITKQEFGDHIELCVKGRLDAYWADHLASALTNTIHDGMYHIKLNFSAVTFLSSAGIRILLKFYKQLKGIHGSLAVCRPSEQVKIVLELAGFNALLFSESAPPISTPREAPQIKKVEKEQMVYEIYEYTPGGFLTCRAIGNRRFGEFLTVAGAAAYLPTDGTNIPDYLIASGAFVPELKVLYALHTTGTFAHIASFETKKAKGGATLSEMVNACLDIAAANMVGIVIVAESAGLMGAALRRSPVSQASEATPFEYPEIQDWFSFSTEKVYKRDLALIVGIATRTENPLLNPFLRQLGRETMPMGHFHAVVFSYRPLKKGKIDLKSTVSTLFEYERLQALLHLVYDDREIEGSGQSEFIRGACWFSPITEVA
ncbi:MAG: STAS domain-containing protein [Planctomycetes bacterium]|nr:STAS domain-containing protein [Planctomycetota bacterium]